MPVAICWCSAQKPIRRESVSRRSESVSVDMRQRIAGCGHKNKPSSGATPRAPDGKARVGLPAVMPDPPARCRRSKARVKHSLATDTYMTAAHPTTGAAPLTIAILDGVFPQGRFHLGHEWLTLGL